MEDHPFDLLESPVRRRAVDLLANLQVQERGMTASELGEALGLHATTARFHLDQLEAAGLVESLFQRRGVGRPRKVYRTPQPPLPSPEAGRPFTELSALLAEAWDGVGGARGRDLPTPEEAGRQWALRRTGGARGAGPSDGHGQGPTPSHTPGTWLGKVGAALDLLHVWGYLPELRTADGGRTAELTLVDCPFLELARDHPGVVCAMHRGLLRGALEAVGEPDTDVGLEPLVAPGRCRATVTTRTPFGAPSAHHDSHPDSGLSHPEAGPGAGAVT